jgi:putative lysine/arginine/ornithine/histidine/octopine transport system substrate-binding protein
MNNKIGLFVLATVFNLFAMNLSLAEEAVPPTSPPQNVSTEAPSTVLPLNVNKLKSGETTLNVGHYNLLPPFYFAEGSPQPGFGYDIFMAVAKKAGIQNVKFVGFDNDADLSSKLEQGKIDVIANSWDLPGARKHFLLTVPYYTKGGLSFLYFKQKGPFQTPEDLKNHTVGVFQSGYAEHYWLPAHNIPKNAIKSYSTLKELMLALQYGNIDVAVVYYPLAQLAQQQLAGQLDSALVQPINDVYALRKQDPELQNILNQAIQSLLGDGTLDKIQAQYINAANANANPQNPSV